MDKVILHCDLNNYYASVECILHPELRGKAVAVCGDVKKRHGIVLAKSQPAKLCGVKTGEAIWQAKQKCPDLVVVPPTYPEYVRYSGIVFDIYTKYTDRVESFGMDECWLDVTESLKLLGDGKTIADKIREEVKAVTGLTISVGVSFTKVFAKLGSDLKKPDAVTVLSRENYKNIVWKLPVSDMLMIGSSAGKKLNELNILTIGDLAKADRALLNRHFGIIADRMIDDANGAEREDVKFYYDKRVPKSVGHGTTTAKDITDLRSAETVVYALSEMVAARLRKYGLLAGGVSIGLKNSMLATVTRQTVLPSPCGNAKTIAENAVRLLKDNYDFKIPLRAISVYTQKLVNGGDAVQISLFDNIDEKEERLEKSVDKIREKYGFKSLQRAVVLNNEVLRDDLHEDDDFLPFKR